MAKTIKTKEISIWIWNEKNRKVFNPLKCRLTQVKVKATFERFIYEKYYNFNKNRSTFLFIFS